MSAAPPVAAVLNRRAGSGRAGAQWPHLQAELQALGVPFRLIDEAAPEAALRAVRALPPGWAVAAIGGDGTASAVLPAVIEQKRPLLILPFGTGNDFAGLLGLRPGDSQAALLALFQPSRQVDALRVRYSGPDGEGAAYVLNGLGMGFDAQLTANLPLAPAWLSGRGRYLWAAARTLRAMRPQLLEVTLDGQQLCAGRAMLCAVMNARSVGGGLPLSPVADIADGLLNVVVAGDLRRRQVPGLAQRLSQGRHAAHPAVCMAAGQAAELRWSQPIYLHLDGDVQGQFSHLQAEVLPGAVALLG